MSIDKECEFVQISTHEWFYLIGPQKKRHWGKEDWREQAQAFGPFHSSTHAADHLNRSQSGVRGYLLHYLPDGRQELNWEEEPLLQKLIQQSRAHPKLSCSPRRPGMR